MKSLLTLLSAVLITAGAFAQRGNQLYLGSRAATVCEGATKLAINQKRNTISYIRLDDNHRIMTNQAVQWLKKDVLKLTGDDQIKLLRTHTDNIGDVHYRYTQYYKNVPVEYGVYYVHSRAGRVRSVNGEWYQVANVNTHPSISASEAYQHACSYVAANVWWHEREEADNNRLMILPFNGSFKLIYKCDVYAKEPWTRQWVYVDAHDGSVVKTENRIHTNDVPGSAVTAYNGTQTIISDSFAANQFRLREYTRGAGVETYNVSEPNDFINDSPDWDLTGSFDIYALDAHFGAEATYDYYNDHYGWKSVDGNGTQKLKSIVHAGPGINAFWDGTYMSYLDGDASMGVTPLTSLEVCGHELTHGVTEHSSGLVYSCESGSINESLSDIFGCTIRFLYTPYGSWKLGDQFNYVIRDMSNPNAYGNPDCYDGLYWVSCPEVHSGSGVGNFWYYLLTEGGSGVNDIGNSYLVSGLGLIDAGSIAAHTNLEYLTSNSEYDDFSILGVDAAQALFGDCSNQAVQTANAFYAVGLGSGFTDAVTSIFSSTQTNFCSLPATVTFINGSLNSTDYLWDFGDGTTSTEMVPVHEYTSEGQYTVSLIVNGISPCNTSDTLVQTAYINVQNVGAPVAPSCTPATSDPKPKYGILGFQLNGINNTSGNAETDGGYRDFACSDFTALVAGDPYSTSINIGSDVNNFGSQLPEDVKMWIDYNNDGVFDDATELVYNGNDVFGTVSFIYSAPVNPLLNTPLRVRIIDDHKNNVITDGCYSPVNGQVEDFSVYFEAAPAVAPVADFTANVTEVPLGGVVNFTDLSTNSPTEWEWEFQGGTPASSTEKNPAGITYNTAGTWDVTLTATNPYGSGVLTKTAYIVVDPVINLCSSFDTTDLTSGTVYDSGGPSGNYGNDENCSLLIHPACASSITFSITSFSSETNDDHLNIYDGLDATAPLLASVTGFPFPYPSVTATSGAMFISWTSDNNQNSYTGFAANWTSEVGSSVTPVADFTISDPNPPYGITVDFADASVNNPFVWHWDFGDGNTSSIKNPSHQYSGSGTFNVTLIASNCGGSDTITHSVTVQAVPVMIVTPATVDVNLSCGTDSYSFPISVFNHGAGDLVYSINEWEYYFQGTQPNILALTYGVDLFVNYPNTIAAINQYFPGYVLTTTTTTDGNELAALLKGKNVFLMAKPEGDQNIYSNYAAALQEFVNNGGTVIFCGAASGKKNCIFNTGLLEGDYGDAATNDPLNVLDPSHPITEGLPATIAEGPKHTYAYTFTAPDVQKLIEFSGFTVVGTSKQGYGNVVYIGFDYDTPNDTASLVIGNTVSLVNDYLVDDWITITPADGGGVLGAGEEQLYTVTITNPGLPAGEYTEYFIVTGNDPANPVDTVAIHVSVATDPCVSVIYENQCGGNYCFSDSVLNGATSVHYDFGDGATSDEQDPCHVYAQSGEYTVMTIGCGSFGCDTIYTDVNVILVSAAITTAGGYYQDNPIAFFSNAENAVSYSWDFGDGFTSTQENPQHTYASEGTYTITLTVTDAEGCTYMTQLEIDVLGTGIGGNTLHFNVSVYPNPANSQTYLQYTLPQTTTIQVELWNGLGQQLSTPVNNESQTAGNYVVPIRMEAAGNYYVKVIADGKPMWFKVENMK